MSEPNADRPDVMCNQEKRLTESSTAERKRVLLVRFKFRATNVAIDDKRRIARYRHTVPAVGTMQELPFWSDAFQREDLYSNCNGWFGRV